jgi:phage internal scaffolding protein
MSFSLRKTHRSQIDFEGDEGLTEQCHRQSCDMHHIMKKHQETGLINHVNQYKGRYDEMPNDLQFHDAMNVIATANSMFESVPSHIRAEFDNSPALFIKFMQDPQNKDQIEKMGLDASHLQSISSEPAEIFSAGNEETLSNDEPTP